MTEHSSELTMKELIFLYTLLADEFVRYQHELGFLKGLMAERVESMRRLEMHR